MMTSNKRTNDNPQAHLESQIVVFITTTFPLNPQPNLMESNVIHKKSNYISKTNNNSQQTNERQHSGAPQVPDRGVHHDRLPAGIGEREQHLRAQAAGAGCRDRFQRHASGSRGNLSNVRLRPARRGPVQPHRQCALQGTTRFVCFFFCCF